jgi:hypothetical protein
MGEERTSRNFLRKVLEKVLKKGLYNEINKSAVKRSEEKRSKNNSNIVKTNPRNKVEKGYPSAYEVETQ